MAAGSRWDPTFIDTLIVLTFLGFAGTIGWTIIRYGYHFVWGVRIRPIEDRTISYFVGRHIQVDLEIEVHDEVQHCHLTCEVEFGCKTLSDDQWVAAQRGRVHFQLSTQAELEHPPPSAWLRSGWFLRSGIARSARLGVSA